MISWDGFKVFVPSLFSQPLLPLNSPFSPSRYFSKDQIYFILKIKRCREGLLGGGVDGGWEGSRYLLFVLVSLTSKVLSVGKLYLKEFERLFGGGWGVGGALISSLIGVRWC